MKRRKALQTIPLLAAASVLVPKNLEDSKLGKVNDIFKITFDCDYSSNYVTEDGYLKFTCNRPFGQVGQLVQVDFSPSENSPIYGIIQENNELWIPVKKKSMNRCPHSFTRDGLTASADLNI